jgi:hypothetical protein
MQKTAPQVRSGLQKGKKLAHAPKITHQDSSRTLLIALNSKCGYCKESIPFYRQIAEAQQQSKTTRVLAVATEVGSAVGQYLAENQLHIEAIPSVDFNAYDIPAALQGQTAGRSKAKVFVEPPEPQRARLAERLKLLTELQQKRQWEGVYDLLLRSGAKGDGKQDFVRERSDAKADLNSRLTNFVPRYTRRHKYPTPENDLDGKWIIVGCGEWLLEGRAIKQESYVEASWVRGDWFFDNPIGFDLPLHGGFLPCPDD